MGADLPKIAIACQGGGIHAAFGAGVLTEILHDLQSQRRFELAALSGTSAGALSALMVWYGLAPKKDRAGSGSAAEAARDLDAFWDGFAALTPAEVVWNTMTMAALRTQEQEVPVLGITMPSCSLNPSGLLDEVLLWQLGQLGVRPEYTDFPALLANACPDFDRIDWSNVRTRLLLGASEIVEGVETVFDSACNQGAAIDPTVTHRWRKRVPLSLAGAAASGTLPNVREAERIDGGSYWDGLYSQNPPIREFLAGVQTADMPDEIWVVRINPQQCTHAPRSIAEIRDRENELMGNLSLNKELDFILTVNDFIGRYGGQLAADYKRVTVRTIKMTKTTAAKLRTSSKFDRTREFIDSLRAEGRRMGRAFLDSWPTADSGRQYPADAAYE